MNPTYITFQENYLDELIRFYVDYYNANGGKWTYQIAYKRLHQIATMENSLVLLQFEKNKLIGFLMGYFKYFDDSTGFYLEEILIDSACQNKGYGSDFLRHLKSELNDKNCDWIELLTTKGAMHQSFYNKNGYTQSHDLVLEFLDLK